MTGDLTVIIPTYNRQKLTERALLSVCNQIQKCQIIVVDDASVPAFELSPELASMNQITLLRHQTNKGAAAARNTGIRSARTDFISFLDSDDFMLPDTLAQRVEFARSKTERVIAGCGWLEHRDKGTNDQERLPKRSNCKDDFFGGCWFCPGSAVIFHRSLFLEKVGLLNEHYRRLEDVEWGIRFSLAGGQFDCLDLVGVVIQHHPFKDDEEIKSAVDWLSEDISARQMKGEVSAQQSRRLHAYLLLEEAASARRAGRSFQASLKMLKSFFIFPRTSFHLVPGWHFKNRVHVR